MSGPDAPGRAIAVVSSHVARGAVGNRAAVFALETLGHRVVAVPTIVLPWHPGHGAATRIVPGEEPFAAFMADLAHGPFAEEIGALLSGYLGAAGQARAIADTVATLRGRAPGFVYACDPVIGDEHGLYVPEPVAAAIARELVPIADIATPNRHELAWLAGRALADNGALIEAARALGPPAVLVTSAFGGGAGRTGNLLVTQDKALLAEHGAFPRAPNGTGDLTAALLLGHLAAGRPHALALAMATASVLDILARTRADGSDELALAADAPRLRAPTTRIAVSAVSEKGAMGARA